MGEFDGARSVNYFGECPVRMFKVKTLKNSKKEGKDEVTGDMIKPWFILVINLEVWKTTVIVSVCENEGEMIQRKKYRGISFLKLIEKPM